MVKEAERYLNEIPLWASKKNSLEAVRDFLRELKEPDESMKIIHVAGTNGKGSVCAYLTSILTEAGYGVRTFISPHLINTKERFLAEGKPVEDQVFCQAFDRVRELADTMTAKGYHPPTYFEFLFYMFMVICQQDRPDFVVLETGLGGLLDTTNVVRHPVLTVITSISMDHMGYLGDTVEKIAAQKAGILKKGVPVVYDRSCLKASAIVEEKARELGCRTYPVSEQDFRFLGWHGGYTEIGVRVRGADLEIRIPSAADYQMINGTLAAAAAAALGDIGAGEIRAEHIKRGVENTFWPGRMEEVLPGVFLDGAHNQGGMEALARAAERMGREANAPVSLMFGVVSDKEYHKMIEELCGRLPISHVTIARMDTERSMEAKELAKEFKKKLSCPVEAFDTVKEAWEHFLETKGQEGPAFCAGSLYLVGEVKALLAADYGREGQAREEEHDRF
ncbi:MAG: bifunctional folylpolyglutamate synthase/dihydrofolate synthase [Hungatella sp.]|jgi:dihydrofolate synthase/folylpolyglutamate synthase|nr:bifunctional folylpolyglutamate synthase/dihydrofolate synthase [Hungatella sp.]